MNDGHFYIYIPLRKQIEDIIEKNVAFLNNSSNISNNVDDLYDFCSGDLYKAI